MGRHATIGSRARAATPARLALVLAPLLLAGCPTVDLGDTPPDLGTCRPDRVYFEDVIWPQYIAPASNQSCVNRAGCHDAAAGRSAMRLSTVEPIDFDANYSVVTRFLNCSTPDNSPLLSKPLAGIDAHGGGDLFLTTSDPAVVAFEAWFQ